MSNTQVSSPQPGPPEVSRPGPHAPDQARDSDSDSDNSIELIRYLPRRRLAAAPPGDDPGAAGYTESAATFPCGQSLAATRVAGRGFITPRPLRPERQVQTDPACPFRVFLSDSNDQTVMEDLSGRAFWLAIGRELYEGPTERFAVPTNSTESWEVIRRLDSENGVPAEEFLRLFTVCPTCLQVMTRHWAEDHEDVCGRGGNGSLE